MSEFAYERELYIPVIRWLDEAGFLWAKHVCTPAYWQCDIAAARFAKRVGCKIPALLESMMIELKLNDTATALRQAAHYSNFVNLVFVAMPVSKCEAMKDKTLTQFEQSGIGLLGVTAETVREFVAPARRPETHPMVIRNLWRRRNVKAADSPEVQG